MSATDDLFDLYEQECVPEDLSYQEDTALFNEWLDRRKDDPDVKPILELYEKEQQDSFDEFMLAIGNRSLMKPNGELIWGRPRSKDCPNPVPIDGVERN